MSRRVTVERVLRDNDDVNGQSIRDWIIQHDDPGCLMIRDRDGSSFIMLRDQDIEMFIADLRAVSNFQSFQTEEQK